MQVVRGYLLTREQTIKRKLKEIFLALELEGKLDKEEIFELYVNRIFLGNRSYGIEAASNTYFNKGLDDLTISESATIAAVVQLPSRINPIKDKRRTMLRRDWILSRMLLLKYINEDEYQNAISEEITIAKNINLYNVEASYIAELVRQEVVGRYGLKAYKEGWSVFTTIDANSQRIAKDGMMQELYLYDKRHGWREPLNFADVFNEKQSSLLNNLDLRFLTSDDYFSEADLIQDSIINRVIDIFDSFPYYQTHTKAMVVKLEENEAYLINENFELKRIYLD
jgi:Membrane carboxypeptidase/penicillin-binding protein